MHSFSYVLDAVVHSKATMPSDMAHFRCPHKRVCVQVCQKSSVPTIRPGLTASSPFVLSPITDRLGVPTALASSLGLSLDVHTEVNHVLASYVVVLAT